MQRVCISAALACLLLPGCGDSAAERAAAEAAVAEAARAAAEAEAAKWKPPEVPAGPPVQKDFADIDEAWAVLSQAGVEQNTEQIWAAIRWLAPQGQPVGDRMTAIMNDTSAGAADRLAACMVLGEMGPAGRPQLITAALSSDLYNVRMRAVANLAKAKPPTQEMVDTLIRMIDEEKDGRVQLHVIRALAEMGESAKAAKPKLEAILENPDGHDRTMLVEVGKALKKIDPRVGFHDMELDE